MDLHMLFQPSTRPEAGVWPQDSQYRLDYATLTNNTCNLNGFKKLGGKEQNMGLFPEHIPFP